MTDPLYVDLHDRELLAEIDMVTELMITATESDLPLCHHTIDAVLDVPGRSRMRPGHCRCHQGAESPAARLA
jgi:hypothetical protein